MIVSPFLARTRLQVGASRLSVLLFVFNFPELFNDRPGHDSSRAQLSATSDDANEKVAALIVDVGDAGEVDAHGFAIPL
jgi:hypothetical protein